MTHRLVTARVVAERFGVSTETILRWARREKIPSVHLSNRAIRFREDEIEAWLEARATPPRGVLTTTPSVAEARLSSVGLTTTDHEE